jgi:hypothetical protein
MNEDRYREWLALELYGELTPDEERELEAALADSASLQRLAHELERGLGVLARETVGRPRPELPEGWAERIRECTAVVPGAGRFGGIRAAAVAAVSGFAAGVLLMLAFTSTGRPSGAPESGPNVEARFERDAPPPPARVKGRLHRLGERLR